MSSGSKENRIIGWRGNVLKLRVKAKAEKGNANIAVIDLLSKVLRVSKREVSIRSGHTSALKTVCIDRLSDSELNDRLLKSDTSQLK